MEVETRSGFNTWLLRPPVEPEKEQLAVTLLSHSMNLIFLVGLTLSLTLVG